MDVRMGKRISGSVERVRERQRRRSDERFAERFAHHWSQHWTQARGERRVAEPPSIGAGPSNFRPAKVPWAVDLAAAWSWRFLVIVAAAAVVLWAISHVTVVVIPLVVALLIAALAAPLVSAGERLRVPRPLTSLLTVVGGFAFVVLLLTFVGQQISQGANDLAKQVVAGLEEIRRWLQDGPLQASDTQIETFVEEMQNFITTSNRELVTRAAEVGTAVGNIIIGLFLALFAAYFFLAEGSRIWAWLVRLFPRAARQKVDSSGRVAWTTLTQFVRATVLVAFVDAVGIMFVAVLLDVPFAAAIGVLVFLSAFVPIVGALVSGFVAVLVALVAQGPLVALLMLGGVVLVQQLESNLLQPFLLGRFVRVHPLGVLVAIGVGVLVAGVTGALVAVPLVASLNSVIQHLSGPPDAGPAASPVGEMPDPVV